MFVSATHAAYGLGGMLAVGSAAALFFMATAAPEPDAELQVAVGADPELQAIEAELYEFRAHWNPRLRERWLDEARPRAAGLAPKLDKLLHLRGHPMTADGLRFAAALEIEAVAQVVKELATETDPEVRAVAIETAEVLHPWTTEELEELLAEEDPQIQIAVLNVCGGRERAPWKAMFAHLVSPRAEVKQAAIDAVPDTLPDDAIEELLGLVRDYDEDTAMAAMQALAHLKPGSRAEAVLALFLEEFDEQLVKVALDALSEKGSALDNPEAVQELAFDGMRSPMLRAHALRCLERTGSYDRGELIENIALLEPLPTYFAARCLVHARAVEGPYLLLELVGNEAATEGPAGLDAQLSSGDTSISTASRQILGWLTGLGPSASVEAFEMALESETLEWDPRAMPAAPAL